jgi:putative transposase
LLVIVGVRADGAKELVALADGYRKSSGSWADLLRNCARRGMRAPILAVGEGALGFWAALRDVFPDTREHRDWVHKVANVVNAPPTSTHPGAKAVLAEVYNAEDKRHALAVAETFAYGAKFPRAVAKITDDQDVTFLDHPAEQWIHRVDLRHSPASHPGDTGAGQPRRSSHGVQASGQRTHLVHAGATFRNGQLVERPAKEAAA